MNAIVGVSVRTFNVAIPISVYIARDWVRGDPYFDLNGEEITRALAY
jgi:hypothetical protein